MNLKRIIREELEAKLGTLYLIVSDDEKFIYGSGKFGGRSFEPVENFTPEKILNSAYKNQEDAHEKIKWAEYFFDFVKKMPNVKRSRPELIALDFMSYNPKIITVDFIIQKRDEKFPMIESEEDEWEWAREIDSSQLNPFYEEGIALQIDTEPTLEQAEMIFEWLVQAGKTTAYLNRSHNRAKNLRKNTYIFGFSGTDWLWNADDKSYSLYVSSGRIRKLIKLSDIFPKKQEQLKEELEDEWEWAKTTQPIELENPEDWIGRSFGYGQKIIDQMDSAEIELRDDEEIFTILRVDENGNLPLLKYHPIYGENYNSSTSPRNLIHNINNGLWVWT